MMYFKPWKGNNCQPRLLHPAKLSFIIGGEKFHYKPKLKDFMTTKPVLQKIYKGILHRKEDKWNHEDMGKNKSLDE
jgi:hypothetical protein